MSIDTSTTRRNFVKGAAAVFAAPYIIPTSVFGANEKLNIAWVGCGGMGWGNLRSIGDDNVIALCDVDRGNMKGAANKWKDAEVYKDFRKMLSEVGDKVDAVGVATPDHTHFPATYMAAAMGKHVFVQKPMAHSIWEIRTLQDIVKKKGVASQMGNQGHTFEGMRLIKEWYQAGLIGDVKEIVAWTNRPASGFGFNRKMFTSYPKPETPPAGLPWDLWLGPVTKEIGYSREFHPCRWRGWWDFGCGGLGDIGCHTLDSPFWCLDLKSPTRIDVKVDKPNPIYSPKGAVVTYHFAGQNGKPPVKITWYEGPSKPKLPAGVDLGKAARGGGMVMIGSKGMIAHGGMRPNSPRLYPEELWQKFRTDPSIRPAKTLPRISGGIIGDWLSSVKAGKKPCSNFDYSGPLTEIIVLGTLAIRTGKSIEFDSKNMKITNNPEADALLKIPARNGWDIKNLT